MSDSNLEIRSEILKLFKKKTSISECFKKLCKKFGDDAITYPDFDFWYMRFAQGKFDLDYDRSQDPKPLEITDLPVDVFKIFGDILRDNCRFTLRKVCKSFRDAVDTWNPGYKQITVKTDKNIVFWEFGDDVAWYIPKPKNRCLLIYQNPKKRARQSYEVEGDFVDVAVDDIVSILKHPKLKLDWYFMMNHDASMSIDYCSSKIFENFIDKMMLKMQDLDIKIYSENVHLEFKKPRKEMKMLEIFQPGTLKIIKIGENAKLNETSDTIELLLKWLNEMEQIKQVDQIEIGYQLLKVDDLFMIPRFLKCPKIHLDYQEMVASDAVKVLKILLKSSTLEYCQINTHPLSTRTIQKHLQKFGAKNVPDRPDFLIYPIPDSDDDVFEIKLNASNRFRTQKITIKRG